MRSVHAEHRRADERCLAKSSQQNATLAVMVCSGGLVLHADGSIAACTLDGDVDGCVGLEERHERAGDLLEVVGQMRPVWHRRVGDSHVRSITGITCA